MLSIMKALGLKASVLNRNADFKSYLVEVGLRNQRVEERVSKGKG